MTVKTAPVAGRVCVWKTSLMSISGRDTDVPHSETMVPNLNQTMVQPLLRLLHSQHLHFKLEEETMMGEVSCCQWEVRVVTTVCGTE